MTDMIERVAREPLEIPRSEWADASGTYVTDETGRRYRILGFIDRPAVILDPVDGGCRVVEVLGCLNSARWTRCPAALSEKAG